METDLYNIEAIIAGRKYIPYKDVIDLYARIDGSHSVDFGKTVNALALAGALDCIEPNRPATIPRSKVCSRIAKNIIYGEKSPSKAWEILRLKLCCISYEGYWYENELLRKEKKVLGLCLSGHLFDSFANEVEHYTHSRLNTVKASREPQWLAGVVAGSRIQQTQRGRLMVVTLDDGTAKIDVSLFDDLIEERSSSVVQDEFLLVFGRVSEDKFSGGLRVIAEEVYDLAQVRLHWIEKKRSLLPDKTECQDEKYKEAIHFVLSFNEIRISEIQRGLRIGYSRASELLERMERDGLVSPMDSNGIRKVISSPTKAGHRDGNHTACSR